MGINGIGRCDRLSLLNPLGLNIGQGIAHIGNRFSLLVLEVCHHLLDGVHNQLLKFGVKLDRFQLKALCDIGNPARGNGLLGCFNQLRDGVIIGERIFQAGRSRA